MTPRSQNVHAGVLREVGSRATPRENECDRRSFLRGFTGLIALPLVVDPLEGWVRRFFPSAAVTPQYTTLAEWARHANGGHVATIVEMLSQTNELLLDMVWMEDTLPRHTAIPLRSDWRRYL